MSTFEELRKIATAKRDKAFRLARKEYNDSIPKIAELESDLQPERRVRPKSDNGTLPDIIFHAAPADRPFSVNDAAGFIRAADPDRKFTIASLRTTINRMKNEGVLKHVSDARGKNRVAIYALANADCESDQKTMVDWAIEVLQDAGKPMKAVEIMVQMTERGFEMQCPPGKSVKHLESEMRKYPRVSGQKGYWRIVGDSLW